MYYVGCFKSLNIGFFGAIKGHFGAIKGHFGAIKGHFGAIKGDILGL